MIEYAKLSKSELEAKLRQVLDDPKYTVAVKQVSHNFRDQKELPIERALWHIEWTIRNPHAAHLESPVLRLGHIAANNYDIIVLFVVVALLSIVITWILFIRCIATWIRKPTHLSKSKKD